MYNRRPNIYGGGAQTNLNGLYFEQITSLDDALIQAGFDIKDSRVYKNDEFIGLSVPKHQFYNIFLNHIDVDYTNYNSKRWLPDEAFINFMNDTVYIIEKKFQNIAGSVDEKLPSCHFKKWEYEKLVNHKGFSVEYIYVFNDWFKDYKYRDTLEYIEDMHCYFYFNYIPLEELGLEDYL